MKANKIFVITLGSDQGGELSKGSMALYTRLISKGSGRSGVAYVPHGVKVSAIGAELFDDLDSEEDIGVYILGHHGMEVRGLAGYTPEQVAKLIVDLGFKHIRKLCLVACRLDTAQPSEGIKSGAGEALDKQKTLTDEALFLLKRNKKVADLRATQAQAAQVNAR